MLVVWNPISTQDLSALDTPFFFLKFLSVSNIMEKLARNFLWEGWRKGVGLI